MSIEWEEGYKKMADIHFKENPFSALCYVPNLQRKMFRKKVMALLGKSFLVETANSVISGVNCPAEVQLEHDVVRIADRIYGQRDFRNAKDRHEYNAEYVGGFLEDFLMALEKLGYTEDQKNCFLEALKIPENRKIVDVVLANSSFYGVSKEDYVLEEYGEDSMSPKIAQKLLDYLHGDAAKRIRIRNMPNHKFTIVVFDILDSLKKGTESYDNWEFSLKSIINPRNVLTDL